jgi:hypothetical protein
LWVEVVKQAVRDLHVPAKRQRDAVSRIEKAYTFFTSRAFREDREMVLQFAGMEAGPFVERLRPKLREVETFLGALRGAAV